MSDPRPTAHEYELAYRVLRPIPFATSPVEHMARLVVGYREAICQRLEALAQALPPEWAAKLRGEIMLIRGEIEEI